MTIGKKTSTDPNWSRASYTGKSTFILQLRVPAQKIVMEKGQMLHSNYKWRDISDISILARRMV